MSSTIKRIALVAVAALGLSGVSVVAANAATTAITTSVPTVGTATSNVNIGATATSTVGFTIGAAAVAADDQTYTNTTVTLVVPASSSVTLADRNGAAAGATAAFSNAAGATANLGAAVNSTTGAVTGDASTADVTAGAVVAGTVSIIPDVAGTYRIIVTSGAGTTATSTIYAADLYVTTADGLSSGTQSKLTANAVAGVANTVTVAVRTTASESRLVTVSGASSSISAFAAGANATAVVASDKLSAVITDDATAETTTLTIATPAVGTISINLYAPSQSGIYSSTAYGTVTITVNSTAVNGSLDAASSTATLNVTGVTGAYLDAEVTTKAYAPRIANTKAAAVVVALASNAGTLSSTTATTISVTGPGLVGFDMAQDGTGDNLGRSLTYTGTDGAFDVFIYGDGNSGASTVTVTTGTFTKSFSINFYGSVASYVVTGGNSYLAAGVTDASIATVKALDSAGIAVPSAVIYVTSSSTATATASSNTITTSSSGAAVAIGATAVAKGATTFTFANAASSATVTATHALNVVTAGIASVALSFDKDEYLPGELVTVTVTAKNSDGDVAGDATYADLFTSAGLSGSTVLQGYTASASVTTVSGKKSYTFYAPLVDGSLKVSATLGASVAAAIQDSVISASTKVAAANGGTDAAIEAATDATEAANAATDAANAAAEAADAATAAAQDAQAAVADLAAQVATLIAGIKAQITRLTNLVVKIQKKVRA